MTLRYRALSALASIILAASGTMGFLHLQLLERSLTSSISTGLATLADTTAGVVAHFMEQTLADVHMIGAALPPEEIRRRGVQSVEPQMKQFMETYTTFANGMFILDPNGILWVDYPPHPELRGSSFTFREYFQRTVSEGRGVVSSPYRSSRTGAPVITVTSPIKDASGELIGVLGCSINLLQTSTLAGIQKAQVGHSGFIQIRTASGQIVLHPDTAQILSSVRSMRQTGQQDVPPMLIAASPIRGTDWVLSAQLPEVEALAPIKKARTKILVGSLLCASFAAMLGAAAIRLITQPLTRLRNAAKQLTSGLGNDIDFKLHLDSNLNAELDCIPRGDEIGDLATAFKEMYLKLEDTLAFLTGAARAWERTFDSVPDAICILDHENRILRLNRFAAKLMGVESEHVIGRTCAEFQESGHLFPFTCSETPAEIEERATSQQITVEAGNRVFEVALTPLLDEDGRIFGSVMVSRDITERNQSELALRESEERFRAITTTAANAIILMDDKGLISYWNPAAENIFGYSSQEVMGKPMHQLIAPSHYQDAIQQGLQNFSATGKGPVLGETIELNARRKDGSLFPVELSTSSIDLKQKWHAMGIIRDITERKLAAAEHERMEAQLRQAQKMEAIGTLAGGVAHDFNNILAAIIGYTELALHEVEEGSKVQRQLGRVLQAGFRAKDLVNQILTFSRKHEQERKYVQIGPILKETMKFLRASLPTTVDIRSTLQDSAAMIHADPIQIHQLVMNLCTNAAYAMRDSGGVLDVILSKTEIESGSSKATHRLKPGSYVRLSVRDTGHGMTPEIMERVFDPFFTTKGKGEGTGLGLSVVYGIIKSLDGAISATSTPGEGTTFEVFLPRFEAEQMIETEITERIPTGSEKILIVDDEEMLVEVAQAMLESLGYRVTGVTDSLKALSVFREDPEAFDLIVTDQTMPAMTGCSFAKEVKRLREDLPIILCTGLMEAVAEEQARQSGIEEFLVKPYVIGELSRTIRKVLDAHQSSPLEPDRNVNEVLG